MLKAQFKGLFLQDSSASTPAGFLLRLSHCALAVGLPSRILHRVAAMGTTHGGLWGRNEGKRKLTRVSQKMRGLMLGGP